MNNISSINDCYGCGVCATICPKKIISIELNEEGFYQPLIKDKDKCINCALCLEVCAFNHTDLALKSGKIYSYAAWSKNSYIRHKCSSGGVGFELGRSLIKEGFKVCGVKYNISNQRAEHYIATNEEELIRSAGSKYIQSYTLDAFRAIKRKEKYLVTGTPCQIDSFRRLIQKQHIEENFILMDFFCHGVPSMLVWKKYIKGVEKITGIMSDVAWRNKTTGWHDSWTMAITGNAKGKDFQEKKSLANEQEIVYKSWWTKGDLFYAFFLGNMCLGKACYNNCKYKYNHSSADIRIGDLWGTTYQNNEEGVSAAIAFTERGNEALKRCDCTFVEHPFTVVAEGQIKEAIRMPKIRDRVILWLQSDMELKVILKKYKLFQLPQRIINKLKRLLK